MAALGLVAAASADCPSGVVSARKVSALSNRLTVGAFQLYVAGTKNGAWLSYFQFADNGADGTFFQGDRVLAFNCGSDDAVGTYVDMWVEGRLTSGKNPIGTTRVMHLIMTDSAADPGSSVEYAAVQIYHPQNPNQPLFERFYITLNGGIDILCDCQPGQKGAAGGRWSTDGLAYNLISGFYPTNRLSAAGLAYWVSGNANGNAYSVGVAYLEIIGGFINGFNGTQIRSFHCTDHGLFGREAEFWADVYYGNTTTNHILGVPGTPRVARIIVTDSALSDLNLGLEFAYVALYHPQNLSKPIYERVLFMVNENEVLCPEH